MSNEIEEDKLLSPKEAAKYLEVHHMTIRRYIKVGLFQGYQIGRNVRVKLSDIKNYIEQSKIK